ncbi:hypothetical protein [Candidatus Phytoplasma citri]|nr:hypothetical protein [Candidatus Phytoplasma aurantifolia]
MAMEGLFNEEIQEIKDKENEEITNIISKTNLIIIIKNLNVNILFYKK